MNFAWPLGRRLCRPLVHFKAGGFSTRAAALGTLATGASAMLLAKPSGVKADDDLTSEEKRTVQLFKQCSGSVVHINTFVPCQSHWQKVLSSVEMVLGSQIFWIFAWWIEVSKSASKLRPIRRVWSVVPGASQWIYKRSLRALVAAFFGTRRQPVIVLVTVPGCSGCRKHFFQHCHVIGGEGGEALPFPFHLHSISFHFHSICIPFPLFFIPSPSIFIPFPFIFIPFPFILIPFPFIFIPFAFHFLSFSFRLQSICIPFPWFPFIGFCELGIHSTQLSEIALFFGIRFPRVCYAALSGSRKKKQVNVLTVWTGRELCTMARSTLSQTTTSSRRWGPRVIRWIRYCSVVFGETLWRFSQALL